MKWDSINMSSCKLNEPQKVILVLYTVVLSYLSFVISVLKLYHFLLKWGLKRLSLTFTKKRTESVDGKRQEMKARPTSEALIESV